ncbi:MAG: type VI secretion system protein TssA [Polaromonas sp.]|nr:type VI secretion system protein TssA [Polaromonas sp.]
MTQDTVFLPDTEALLAPIAGVAPAGASMRYDPLYLGIVQSRQEDDPSLPMGDWERPLKKADWKAAAANCTQLLGKSSKDFQAAAWLCESWTHLHQVDGFTAAVDVLTGLVERYWDTAHPLIEDGDDDARAATFVWMNENLPLTLKLHITLLHVPDRIPSAISLADWDQALIADNQKSDEKKKPNPAGGNPVTREDLTSSANGKNLLGLIALKTRLQVAAGKWDALAQMLDGKMGTNPPSIARVGEMLRRIERAATSLIDGRSPVQTPPQTPVQAPTHSTEEQTMNAVASNQDEAAGVASAVLQTGHINSREDAYRLLEAVAEYLQKAEPHSPTPYLVKRAVSWGRMSLADLMQEVVREEGDIARYFSLLGIKESRE